MSNWVNRTYTYSEPVDSDSDSNSHGITGPDTLTRSPGNRPDFDAGYEDGRKSGFVAGYSAARQRVNVPLTNRDAWAAGFIDGEGSIGIERPRKSRSGSYSLRLSATQMRIEPLIILRDLYGGKIRERKGIWEWSITCSSAANALRKMLPYLTVKYKEAALGIQFQDTVMPRGTLPKGYSEDQLRMKESMYQLMKQFKLDGLREHDLATKGAGESPSFLL